jgi:hypothetical protein
MYGRLLTAQSRRVTLIKSKGHGSASMRVAHSAARLRGVKRCGARRAGYRACWLVKESASRYHVVRPTVERRVADEIRNERAYGS